MRQFKLLNAKGEQWDLTTKDSWFQNPSGLGLEQSISSIKAGYDWVETDHKIEQQTISGEIVFSGYRRYAEFIRFCYHAPLTLCYRPLDKWYYRTCKLDGIRKTEINFGHQRLLCPVDFLCLSTWYDRVISAKTALDPTHGKTYSYTYPYIYAETSAGSAEINNAAVIESPCKLHIRGPVINPTWAMIVSGAVVAAGKVEATIPIGNKLVVDASPASMEISEYTVNNEFVQSLYGQSDFSTQRFLFAPPGVSRVTFTHEGSGAIDAWIEVKQLAISV